MQVLKLVRRNWIDIKGVELIFPLFNSNRKWLFENAFNDPRVWGALSARIRYPGADLLIAEPGLTRNAQIVTGNVADFKPIGTRTLNPF